MGDLEKLALPRPFLEHLRCAYCKEFLSCSPIQLLSNGKSICGTCVPSGDDGSTSRELTLEALLQNVLFPCRYEGVGCNDLLEFCKIHEHQSKCIHRRPFCPAGRSVHVTCTWTGPWAHVSNHIRDSHPNYVKKNPEFKIEIMNDAEEVFMAKYMGVTFMIYYSYICLANKFLYLIQCLPSDRDFTNLSYKLRLTNSADPAFSCTLNKGKCVPLNYEFARHSENLYIADYLDILNKPEFIIFNVEFATDLSLDCRLLGSLRCRSCHGYLIPPILDSEKGVICYDCFDDYRNCKPSNNEELKEVIANTNYPCRWDGCDFVDKGVNIRKHELECRFCVYQCPGSKPSTSSVFIENCDCSFKADEAVAHFDKHLHKFVYFGDDEFLYRVSLAKFNPDPKLSIFTLKYGRIILIQGGSGWDQHTVSVRISEGYLSPNGQKMHLHPIKCKLRFGHDHCLLKSKEFVVSTSRTFKINDFPDCFKANENLSVTLKLFQEIISI